MDETDRLIDCRGDSIRVLILKHSLSVAPTILDENHVLVVVLLYFLHQDLQKVWSTHTGSCSNLAI